MGQWYGYIYDGQKVSSFSPMDGYSFLPNKDNPQEFYAFGWNALGEEYNVSGHWKSSTAPGNTDVRFTLTIATHKVQEYVGVIDQSGTFNGDIYYSPGNRSIHTSTDEIGFRSQGHPKFIFRQVGPEIMKYRPLASLLSKPSFVELWQFAITAVLCDIRKRRWSWTYFRERKEWRTKFLNLHTSMNRSSNTRGIERTTYAEVMRYISPSDDLLYRIIQVKSMRLTTQHW